MYVGGRSSLLYTCGRSYRATSCLYVNVDVPEMLNNFESLETPLKRVFHFPVDVGSSSNNEHHITVTI